MSDYNRQDYLDWVKTNITLIQKAVIDSEVILDNYEKSPDSSNTGIYRVFFGGHLMYLGESGNNMYYRVCQHLKNYFVKETLGFTKSELLDCIENKGLKFSFTFDNDERYLSSKYRLDKEKEFVLEECPLTQYPDMSEYPKDKSNLINGKRVSRKDVPEDICVLPKIRRKRVIELFCLEI